MHIYNSNRTKEGSTWHGHVRVILFLNAKKTNELSPKIMFQVI